MQLRGEQYLACVESVATEVTNAVISWGSTLVVLNNLRENMNSTLLNKMSTVRDINNSYMDVGSATEMANKVVAAGLMFDAIGRVILPENNRTSSHIEDSMDDINNLFEQHAMARNAERIEKERLAEEARLKKRSGRFGPDEIFRQEDFQEAEDAATSCSTVSGFNKRTVNVGFYLENEIMVPLKKRRTGQADLNAMNTAVETIETRDPGGVNTSNPLSVMLLNQLAASDPAFQAAFHSPTRPTVSHDDNGEGKKSTEGGEGFDEGGPAEMAWGVIGPAVEAQIGSGSINDSGGSGVPIGGKPSGYHDVKYSSLAAEPASAISEDTSLLAPVRVGRPASAYGLDKNVYEDGQGVRYKGFSHIPLATTTEGPMEFGGMLDRLESNVPIDISDSEEEEEVEEKKADDEDDFDLDVTEDAESMSSKQEKGYIFPDSISLSSETQASDIMRYRNSIKRTNYDPEIVSLASESVAAPTWIKERNSFGESDDKSINSELTDPLELLKPLGFHSNRSKGDDSESEVSLESSSVMLPSSFAPSNDSTSNHLNDHTGDGNIKDALDRISAEKRIYKLRVNVSDEKDSTESSDDETDGGIDIILDENLNSDSDGTSATESGDGDVSSSSSEEESGPETSSSESDDMSDSGDDITDADSDIGKLTSCFQLV